MAFSALEYALGAGEFISLVMAAFRAGKAIGPALGDKIGLAAFIVGKTGLKFDKSRGIVAHQKASFHLDAEVNVRWQLKSTYGPC